jgi:hypothetical protein
MDLIIPERLRGRHRAGWQTAMQTGLTRYGSGQPLAVPVLRKDQSTVMFNVAPRYESHAM